jgi:hypothetical protein
MQHDASCGSSPEATGDGHASDDPKEQAELKKLAQRGYYFELVFEDG